MFKTTSRNGFHISFGNGYTVSVQWNPGNYCSNPRGSSTDNFDGHRMTCATAEVAAWKDNGLWLRLGEDDDVIGWQTAEEVAAIIDRVSKL
jgi:hypothetical protein